LPKVLVDPHIHPEQLVTRQESIPGDKGLHSLGPLKEEAAGATAAALANAEDRAPSMASAVTGAVWWKERRQSCRFRCSGRAEFQEEGREVRIEGTLTNVSLHGCYLEMKTTFPVGTRANLMLEACGIRLQAAGEVRASYPSLGMGILFSELEPAHQLQLKELLVTLAWNSAVPLSPPTRAAAKDKKNSWTAAEARTLIDEITAFFRENQLLSREEFHQIVKRVRRS
jgi:hypothetical protein